MKNLFLSIPAILLVALSCGKEGGDGSGEETSLAAPQNLTVKALTETTATIQWDPVEGAKTYRWEVKMGSEVVTNGGGANRNASVTGLSAGTTYLFSVSASNDGGTSGSSSIEFTTEGSVTPVDPEVRVACIDEPLVLTFTSTPTLGTAGQIKLFTAAGQEVDCIDLKDLATVDIREDGQMVPKQQMTKETLYNSFMDRLYSGKRYRIVHYTPLQVEGKSVTIRFHSGVMDFGQSYYVTMDAGVIAGDPGIQKGDVEFRVKAAPSNPTSLKVAADGSADFCTIQGALSYASTTTGAVTIDVAPGTYREMLFLRERADVLIRGASRETTVLAYANAEALANGSGASIGTKPTVGQAIGAVGGRGVCLFENCDNLVLENLTMRNTYGAQGQAEVLYFNSGSNAHKLTLENCALHSLQDTFLTKGQVWVHNSLIAGNVDFIWGYPKACLFEDCEIRCEKYSKGFILQARVPGVSDKGFVFLNCRITAGEGAADGTMYLARSGGSTDYYDNVTFVNCQMSPVIAPVGWYSDPTPNPATPTATSGWKEYGTTGVSTASRNSLGRILTAEEAAAYSSKEAVLGW